MQYLSQNDPRWKNNKLGSCPDTFGKSGCVITALAMLSGKEPPEVNAILLKNSGYFGGCLVDWGKAAKLLGLSYDTNTTKAMFYPTIGETRHFAPKVPQHFFVILNDKTIIDPLDGKIKPISAYRIVGYRNMNIGVRESAILPPKENQMNKADDLLSWILGNKLQAWKRGDSPDVYFAFRVRDPEMYIDTLGGKFDDVKLVDDIYPANLQTALTEAKTDADTTHAALTKEQVKSSTAQKQLMSLKVEFDYLDESALKCQTALENCQAAATKLDALRADEMAIKDGRISELEAQIKQTGNKPAVASNVPKMSLWRVIDKLLGGRWFK